MTLLVVHNNSVYVDSLTTYGDTDINSSKVVHFRETISYSCAGTAESAQMAMEELAVKGFHNEVTCVTEDSSETVIIAKFDDEPGFFPNVPYVLDLSRTKPRFFRVHTPNELGVQMLAGSGWRFFLAYLHEHGNLQTALELTAKYHRDVALPFERF